MTNKSNSLKLEFFIQGNAWLPNFHLGSEGGGGKSLDQSNDKRWTIRAYRLLLSVVVVFFALPEEEEEERRRHVEGGEADGALTQRGRPRRCCTAPDFRKSETTKIKRSATATTTTKKINRRNPRWPYMARAGLCPKRRAKIEKERKKDRRERESSRVAPYMLLTPTDGKTARNSESISWFSFGFLDEIVRSYGVGFAKLVFLFVSSLELGRLIWYWSHLYRNRWFEVRLEFNVFFVSYIFGLNILIHIRFEYAFPNKTAWRFFYSDWDQFVD